MSLLPLMASAQDWRGYRGFFDLYCGMSMGSGESFSPVHNLELSDFRNEATFGFNITGGYQVFPFLFAGVGFGAHTTVVHTSINNFYDDYVDKYNKHTFYSIYFPVFADFRWTLNINSVVTPFVDVKIGYQFGTPINEGYLTGYYDVQTSSYNSEIDVRPKSGVYFQPSVGVRFGKGTAFNLGIAYNPSIGKEFVMVRSSDNSSRATETVIGKSSTGSILLTLGVDF